MNETLTPAALQLILNHEVGGGRGYYNAALKRPTWPGGESGVTIGIGYDLGYTPAARFFADWSSLPESVTKRLGAVLGYKSLGARAKAREVRDIEIPWELAFEVWKARTVPFWIRQTLTAFPGAEHLPADAFGALVSLVFNRGPALHGKNRQDMEDIHDILADGVQSGDLKEIAKQLREMKAIWSGQGLDGLLRRREDEAKLVEAAQ